MNFFNFFLAFILIMSKNVFLKFLYLFFLQPNKHKSFLMGACRFRRCNRILWSHRLFAHTTIFCACAEIRTCSTKVNRIRDLSHLCIPCFTHPHPLLIPSFFLHSHFMVLQELFYRRIKSSPILSIIMISFFFVNFIHYFLLPFFHCFIFFLHIKFSFIVIHVCMRIKRVLINSVNRYRL